MDTMRRYTSRRGLRLRISIFAALLAGMSLAPAAHAARPASSPARSGWSTPVSLGSVAFDDAFGAGAFTAAINGDRQWTAAWIAPSGRAIRMATRGGRGQILSATRTVYTARPDHYLGGLRAGMDLRGDVLVAFTEVTLSSHGAVTGSVINLLARGPGRYAHARVQTVSPRYSEQPAIAVAPSGEAVVVFQHDRSFTHPGPPPLGQLPFDGQRFDDVMAAARPAGGSFGAPVAISAPTVYEPQAPAGVQPPLAPQVTIASDGEVIAAWARTVDSSGTQAIEAGVRPAGGAFGAPAQLATGTFLAPQLAADASGDATVAWNSYRAANGQSTGVHASARQAGGPFGPAQAVAPYVLNAGSPDPGFSLAVDAAGTTKVVWGSASNACIGGGLHFATRPRGGTFSAPAPVRRPHFDHNRGLPPSTTYPNVVALGPRGFVTTWFEILSRPTNNRDNPCAIYSPRGLWFDTGTGGSAPPRRTPLRGVLVPPPVTSNPPPLVIGSPAGLGLVLWSRGTAHPTLRAMVYGPRR